MARTMPLHLALDIDDICLDAVEVRCSCGVTVTGYDARDALDAHHDHALAQALADRRPVRYADRVRPRL